MGNEMRYSIVGQKHLDKDPYLPGFRAGIPAVLVREPDNPADPNAVAVYVNGEKVGFIPRRDNVAIARLIDATGETYAETIAAIGLAVDANSPQAQQRTLVAKFIRSPNSAYPQVEIDESLPVPNRASHYS